jgi:uncharacterized membrane protein YccC
MSETPMPERTIPHLRRSSALIALGALGGAVFALTDRYALKVVPTSPTQALWLVGLAVLLVLVGAVLAQRALVGAWGVLAILVGLLQLVTDGTGWTPIPGGVGTAALFVAVGIGALALWAASRSDEGPRPSDRW